MEHILASTNSPLRNLSEASGDIFQHPTMIHSYWNNLKTMFKLEGGEILGDKSSTLLVVCYSGETSRLANSILRAAGYNAFHLKGGYRSIKV